MTPEAATAFLQALGVSGVARSGAWVRAKCPLAPYTHKNGTDSTPSFGVPLGGAPSYNCFTCRSGSLETLINELHFYDSRLGKGPERDFKAAREILEKVGDAVSELPAFSEFSKGSRSFSVWPEYFLNWFTPILEAPAHVKDYLFSRGITARTATKFGLLYDETRDMVIFPYRNWQGMLAGARGRAVGNTKYKHHDYQWEGKQNTSLVFYNEQVFQQERPVVLVEGQFDALAVARHYSCVVANLTARPTPEKLKTLANAPYVYLLLDSDETGKMAASAWMAKLARLGKRATILELPQGFKDPSSTPPHLLKEVLSPVLSGELA